MSGSDDRSVRVWSVATGTTLQTLEGHSGSVNSVVFSPDGESVASGSNDETVRIWNTATGAVLQTLEGHSDYVFSVAFSPDGSLVVSGSGDETIRVWDAATGETLQTLKGHSGAVSSVAFSQDGRSIVSGSWDGTVRLWDVATGSVLQTLEGRHSGDVNSVALSPFPHVREVHILPVSGNWIKEGRRSIMWLYPYYETEFRYARKGVAVLAQQTGRIFIFNFKDGPNPL